MTGKKLAELTYEVDVLHKYLVPENDDGRSCINWCPNGTLAYFDGSGYPAVYFSESHPSPHDNREDFTSLERFIAYLKKWWGDSNCTPLALKWVVYDDGVEAFNSLLGDIKIDL